MKKWELLILIYALIALGLYGFCGCGQNTPVAAPVSTGIGEVETGDNSKVEDNDVTETEIETTQVQNSTWLLLGQKIIDSIKFVVIFIVIAIIIYRWVAYGSISILGPGRK